MFRLPDARGSAEQRDCGWLGGGAEGAQRALELFKRCIHQRVVALARREPHQLSGGFLATAVDLQNVLIVLNGLFRLVILDQHGQPFQGIQIQLLHMRSTPIDP